MQREGMSAWRAEGDPAHHQGQGDRRDHGPPAPSARALAHTDVLGLDWSRAPTRRRTASSTPSRRWWRSGSPSSSACRAPVPTAIPFPECWRRKPIPIPLSLAQAGQELRGTHHGGGGSRPPAAQLPLGERSPSGGGAAIRRRAPTRAPSPCSSTGAPSPWAWSASGKIWVYDPKEPVGTATATQPGRGTRSWRSRRRERNPRRERQAEGAAARCDMVVQALRPPERLHRLRAERALLRRPLR